MNKQYKTTEEVAVAFGVTDEKEYFSTNDPDPLFELTPEKISQASQVVKDFLEDPERSLDKFPEYLANLVAPIALFNVLGNPRDYNYRKGVAKTPEEIQKSLNILREEVSELKEAMETNNTAEIVDAVCDIIYVTLGLAIKTGTLLETCVAFPLVCHNNLLKLKEDAEGNFYADVVNGKIQKPEGFKGLDLSKIIPTLKGGDNA